MDVLSSYQTYIVTKALQLIAVPFAATRALRFRPRRLMRLRPPRALAFTAPWASFHFSLISLTYRQVPRS